MPPEIKIQQEQQQYILCTLVHSPLKSGFLNWGNSILFATEVLCVTEMCRQRWGVSFACDENRRLETSLLNRVGNHSLESNYAYYLTFR